MNVLTIQNLSKSFGKQKIIDDLNLAVPEGCVFGFIGQNGAGKTTTMKMVLGLLQPDHGEIRVCNEAVCFGQTKTMHAAHAALLLLLERRAFFQILPGQRLPSVPLYVCPERSPPSCQIPGGSYPPF